MTISRKLARLLAAVGVAGAAAAAGTIGLAAAQSPTTTTPPTTTAPATAAPSGATPTPPAEGKGGGHRGGPSGGFGGFGGALHGEFVVAKDGGYETLATQNGKVTDVSSTAITVVSDDGYSKTYAVAETTVVNAGRDGIDSVKKDDTVNVTATVDGATVTAVNIVDRTNIESSREGWLPDRPDKQQPTTTTTTS
jgi:hypothetical protein